MKGRVFFLLGSSIFLILLISGCQFTIPNQFTGPAWTTKVSIPLIMRTKNPNGTSNSEFRLDNELNGRGEPGANLVGINLSNYYLPPEELGSGEIGTMNIDATSFTPVTINFPAPGGALPLSNVTSDTISLGDYAGFTLSNSYENGVKNTLTVQITSGSAGVGGLTVSLSGRQVTINEGASSGYISLDGFSFTDNLTLTLNGNIVIDPAGGSISFTFSPTLEVARFTIDPSNIGSSAVNSLLSFPGMETPIDLSQLEFALQLNTLQFTLEAPDLPANLKATVEMDLITRDTETGPDLSSTPITRDLDKNTPIVFDLVEAGINDILTSGVSFLVLKIADITLGPVDAGQNIIINSTDKIAIKVTPKIGLASIGSEVQSMPIEPIEQNIVKSVSLNFDITNNTPLGLTLKAYLAPGPDVKTNPSRIELTLEIPSSQPGVPKTAKSSLNITAQQLADLTASGTMWNQFELVAATTVDNVQANPSPYLEIRSYAQAELLVNKQ